MKLQAGIYDQVNDNLLLDCTHMLAGLRMSNGRHGSQKVTAEIVGRLYSIFWLFSDGLKGHKFELNYGPLRVWSGRVETPELVAGGIVLAAYGHWRAFSDVLYTALWSTQKATGFRVGTTDDLSTIIPAMWYQDKSERLAIETRKGESYHNKTSRYGGWTYEVPDESDREISEVSFDYDLLGPSGDFDFHLWSSTRAWGSLAAEFGLNTSGSLQSASQTETFSTPRDRIFFSLRYVDTETIYAGDSGDHYVHITNIRVATQATPIDSDDVANALLSYVRAINADWLIADASLIESAGLDIKELAPQDARPADVLTYLAELGDSSQNAWEVGVDDKTLYLRQLGSQAKTWYVDAADIKLRRDLGDLFNEAYGIYSDIGNKDRRSSSQLREESKAEQGITRHAFADTGTSDATDAADQAAALAAISAEPTPRAAFVVDRVFGTSNGVRPLPGYLIKAHDTIIIRNLPIALATSIPDRFSVGKMSINIAEGGAPVIEPLNPIPTINNLVALAANNTNRVKPVEAPKPGYRPPVVYQERA